MPFNTTYANNILSVIFGKTASLPAPKKVYLALSSNDPEADGGSFTELSGGGYARVLISNLEESYPNLMGNASGRAISNTAQINWNKATAAWKDIKGWALYDAPSGGNQIYYGKITNETGTVSVGAGAVALFDPGTLRITLSTTDEDV